MVYNLCEPVGADEPSASEVVVEPGRTPGEIAAMVLERADNLSVTRPGTTTSCNIVPAFAS